MESSKRQKHFVILVGLPGSGKSTLAQKLKSELNSQVISFDKIEQELLIENQKDTFSPELWQQARDQAYSKATEFLNDSTSEYLILDDNFYYRSMRQPFYRLARDHLVSYHELHLTCSLETTLLRNSFRKGLEKVPDQVILRMHKAIEGPIISEMSISVPSDMDIINDQLLEFLTQEMIPPQVDLQNIREIEPQVFMDKVDQGLKKTFASILKDQPELKQKAKELNLIRSELYNFLKSLISKSVTLYPSAITFQKDFQIKLIELVSCYKQGGDLTTTEDEIIKEVNQCLTEIIQDNQGVNM